VDLFQSIRDSVADADETAAAQALILSCHMRLSAAGDAVFYAHEWWDDRAPPCFTMFEP
jgi:hypothetical protein